MTRAILLVAIFLLVPVFEADAQVRPTLKPNQQLTVRDAVTCSTAEQIEEIQVAENKGHDELMRVANQLSRSGQCTYFHRGDITIIDRVKLIDLTHASNLGLFKVEIAGKTAYVLLDADFDDPSKA